MALVRLLLPVLALGVAVPGPGPIPSAEPARARSAGLVPLFVENRGQTDPRVRFELQGTGTFALDGALRISLSDRAGTNQRWGVELGFEGARAVRPEPVRPSSARIGYFHGGPAEWRTGLRTFTGLVYRDLWPGIDLLAVSSRRGLKYEFHVAPGADPAAIGLVYRGARVSLRADGSLVAETPAGAILDERPVSYQVVAGERAHVESAYELRGSGAGFRLGRFDPSLPLVIDPVLVYSGFIGGSSDDIANAVAVDAAGNAYLAGQTGSTEATFPETIGPDTTHNGSSSDAWVAKVDPAGALVFAGYIGGSDIESAEGVAVDASGAVYVGGTTRSNEAEMFPLVVGPDLTFEGVNHSEGFLTKVKPDGTGLVYSGYVGGSLFDIVSEVALGPGGALYAAGATGSSQATFEPVMGPDLSPNGEGDAFVAAVRPDGTGFLYKGYLGGSGAEEFQYGLAVDAAGSAFVAGATESSDFPVLVGPDLTFNDPNPADPLGDAFVTKVKPDGSGLLYSGFIGGSHDDEALALALASDGSAYVAGRVEAPAGFPLVAPLDASHGGNGRSDGFLSKVAPMGDALTFSTFLGGGGEDLAEDAAVGSDGGVHVVLETNSPAQSLPAVGGPGFIDNGEVDVFLMKIDALLTRVVHSTFHGGGGDDSAGGVAVDPMGAVVIAGSTDSGPPSFAVLAGPSLTNSGRDDAFVARFAVTERCAGMAPTHFGTPGVDLITGTGARDVILALGGNDTIRGLAGDDRVCAGTGHDRLSGGSGKDRLLGQAGDDRLSGGGGTDRLHGGAGRDACSGGRGTDRAKRCERRASIP